MGLNEEIWETRMIKDIKKLEDQIQKFRDEALDHITKMDENYNKKLEDLEKKIMSAIDKIWEKKDILENLINGTITNNEVQNTRIKIIEGNQKSFTEKYPPIIEKNNTRLGILYWFLGSVFLIGASGYITLVIAFIKFISKFGG